MTAKEHRLQVNARLPEALSSLPELATNLLFSWDRHLRGLFYRMDANLWQDCNHNPKLFLRRISQQRLDALAADQDFLDHYHDVVAAKDAYLGAHRPALKQGQKHPDLIAYFCMEFGLHESLPLYSGGLGILAGDLCKAASDLHLPFLGVGLMYRVGFSNQTITRTGEQLIDNRPTDPEDLPVILVVDDAGQPILVNVQLPGRLVTVQIWKLVVGRINLYLLDTDHPDNASADRGITHQLYGGDRHRRIEQEMILGLGGVRALRALGLAPSVWHINEGHPALLILERCREAVAAGLEFDAALELVASDTVFTTHTAVPAGHDLFDHSLIAPFLSECAEELGVSLDTLLALGTSPHGEGAFNMTALALRGSRQHNGVSATHRDVAADMEGYIWPEIEAAENPIRSVSNGVHVSTFLAREWVDLFNRRFPEWRQHLCDAGFWRNAIESLPDHRYWNLTQSLKAEMLAQIGDRLLAQLRRNNVVEARLKAVQEAFSQDNCRALVIGFARRFATYKRALLLFQDSARLGRLLNDPERPVMLLFSGKAHPADAPGQALISRLHALMQQPPFRDRLFLLEGYDMALARRLVAGVDVWLNTPEYPLEASGTSGQKAAINGVINLSVLDGWWAEGFDGSNGWAITPHVDHLTPTERDKLEAQDLLDLLEREVIPTYFAVGPGGYSPTWIERSKRSMYTVMPRFNAERMARDYLDQYYIPAERVGRSLQANAGEGARDLAHWKHKVRLAWKRISLQWAESPPEMLENGEILALQVRAELDGLDTDDVRIECLLQHEGHGSLPSQQINVLQPLQREADGSWIFAAGILPPNNGVFRIRVRMYPFHDLLQHPFEVGLLRWL